MATAVNLLVWRCNNCSSAEAKEMTGGEVECPECGQIATAEEIEEYASFVLDYPAD